MLRAVSAFPRIPSPSHSRVQFAKISMEAGPLCPKFIPVDRSAIQSLSKHEGQRFSVVSYNILAQVYVKSVFFPHSPASGLRWKVRSEAVLSLLKNLGTDFLCLQEVDEYDTFYKGKMRQLGYSSIYIKRTGKKRDGCGIFYKCDSAELLLQETIEYNDLLNSISDASNGSKDASNASSAKATKTDENENDSVQKDAQGNHRDLNNPRVRLKRDSVGIMGAFRLKGHSDHHVIVANTHLYWDPALADVKLAQAKYLLSRLAQFQMTVSERLNCTPSLIVTGDFNSTPGDQVYQQLISGSSAGLVDDELPIPLISLHAHTRGGEPPFTNCTPGFTGTLDYIFFSPSESIEPVSYLELPEPESPSVVGGLPNHSHPSDHLPIGAEFEVVQAS